MERLSLAFILASFMLITNQLKPATALPLRTESRWIVDEADEERVKLACVNWVAHLEPVVAEGLSKQPVDAIPRRILDMGFNCVRLTWPLFLATNQTLASLTVRQSFLKLGLVGSIAGFQVNNPSIIDLTLIQAYQAVVSSLAENNVMVILDNHISTPGWCCNDWDENGFFWDRYFNPDLWIKGLTRMATMFRDTPNVVGMSLRNELRGPKQNVDDWYRYMQKGAEAVHLANPDVLVILSGLSYDKDFSFLHSRPVNLTFNKKLVLEAHWYGFSDGEAWKEGNPNQVCGEIVNSTMKKVGFVLDEGYPLFLSEFGVDQRGTNVNDNRYLNCFLGVAAELDFDWALWTLVGDYYLREGVIGMEEFYGMLSWDWSNIRNSSFLKQISAIQSPFQGPYQSDSSPHKVIFHPSTGLCVQRESTLGHLKLGVCSESEAWIYTNEKVLEIQGTSFCLQTIGLGQPAKLGSICSDSSSKWKAISDSKMHLSANLDRRNSVCMDINSDNIIVTNKCKCLNKDSMCDPESQWFKIVSSTTTSTSSTKSSDPINSIMDSDRSNPLASY